MALSRQSTLRHYRLAVHWRSGLKSMGHCTVSPRSHAPIQADLEATLGIACSAIIPILLSPSENETFSKKETAQHAHVKISGPMKALVMTPLPRNATLLPCLMDFQSTAHPLTSI